MILKLLLLNGVGMYISRYDKYMLFKYLSSVSLFRNWSLLQDPSGSFYWKVGECDIYATPHFEADGFFKVSFYESDNLLYESEVMEFFNMSPDSFGNIIVKQLNQENLFLKIIENHLYYISNNLNIDDILKDCDLEKNEEYMTNVKNIINYLEQSNKELSLWYFEFFN